MDIEVIKRFEKWLVEDGKAATTIASYLNDVRKFNVYLDEKDCDKEIVMNRLYFTSYLKFLKGEGMAINTINKKITSLKVYNDWLISEEIVEELYVHMKRDKIRIADGSEAEVSILDDEQVERFLFHLEKETKRNRVMGYLLLYTGVRVSELISIKMAHIDQLTNHLKVIGKGGKIRDVPLRSDVLEVLQNYIKDERASSRFASSEYLLVSQRTEKMHRDTVRKWLEQVGEKLKFHIHPHMLRHTFCTRLLKNGVDLTVVAKLAGHSSVNTTMKHYINISKKEKEKAIELLWNILFTK